MPITVAELIERLKAFDQAALVMIKCTDDYYSGPLSQIDEGRAVEIAPFEYDIPPVLRQGFPPSRAKYPGGWELLELDEDTPEDRPVISERKCILIRC